MTVKITKPEINVREQLTELKTAVASSASSGPVEAVYNVSGDQVFGSTSLGAAAYGGNNYNQLLFIDGSTNGTKIRIGKTSSATDHLNVYNLYNNGHVRLMATTAAGATVTMLDAYPAGGVSVTGDFTASGNITAYSDKRLKEEIRPIDNALDKVQQISGKTFSRNDLIDTNRRYAGVIAQEIEAVLPEAVSETMDGTKTVDYNGTIALLIESIKELKTEVDKLNGRLSDLGA